MNMLIAQQEMTAHSPGQLDTASALWLLGSLAGFYRRPFDTALVLQRFAPPFDFPSLIEVLEALGLKAGLAEWPEEDWSSLPLPAVVFLPKVKTGPQPISTIPELVPTETISSLPPALIVKHGGHTPAWVHPGQASSEPLSAEIARAQCLPLILLAAEAEPLVSESVGASLSRAPEDGKAGKPFGFSWFIPELLRHKMIWRVVLIASLAIQPYRYAGKEDITLDFDRGAATLKFADGTQAILSSQTSPGDFAAAPFSIQFEDKLAVAPYRTEK